MKFHRLWVTSLFLFTILQACSGGSTAQPTIAPSSTPSSKSAEPVTTATRPNAAHQKKSESAPKHLFGCQLETYTSAVMAMPRTYGLCLPPTYAQKPQQHYPVIFLLHGGHGQATDWLKAEKGRLGQTLKQLYAANTLTPSIVVTPDGNDRRGSSPYWDPQYLDGPNGNVSTAIGKELVQVIQSRYRTLPAPAFWAIGGLSSGGWGALNIGLQHPEHFAVLFSESGYFSDPSGPQNSPLQLVSKVSPTLRKRLRIYLNVGDQDKHVLMQTTQFHQVLDELKIANTMQQFPGSHTWRFWRQHLTDALTYVGQQFQPLTKVK